MLMTRKLFIEEGIDPWITWQNELYRLQETTRGKVEDTTQFYGVEVVASPWAADTCFINYNAIDIQDPVFQNKDVFVFIPELQPNAQHELEILGAVQYANGNNWTVVTESLNLYEKLLSANLNMEPWLWHRPSRVSSELIYPQEQITTTDTIVSVFDAAHPLGHAADLVKAYLGAFMILRDDHGIEPILKIFSHTELPFEPFNEIFFEGMVPNKRLIKEMQRARLFIFPAETENYPNPLVEAAQLGVPSFYYRPEETPLKLHDVFPDTDYGKYKNVEELTHMIINHFTSDESKDTSQSAYAQEEHMEFGLHMFLTEVSRRLGVGPLKAGASE
jgi:hypothetical protein